MKTFNVKDYGAMGDGKHNDTQSIQLAMNEASRYMNEAPWWKKLWWKLRRKGPVVHLATGGYRVEAPIVSKDADGEDGK